MVKAPSGEGCLSAVVERAGRNVLQTAARSQQLCWEVAFNPAGQTLASGSADRSARLWNVQGGTCLKTFQGRTNGVRSVSFSRMAPC